MLCCCGPEEDEKLNNSSYKLSKIGQSPVVCFIGKSGVGKTSILQNYKNLQKTDKQTCFDIIPESEGIEFEVIKVHQNSNSNKKNYKILKIYDIAGNYIDNIIAENIIKNAEVIVLIYSVDDIQSLQLIKQQLNILNKVNDYALFYIVANKQDLISKKENPQYEQNLLNGSNLAQDYDIPFCSVSASQNSNLKTFFQSLAENSVQIKRNVSRSLVGHGNMNLSKFMQNAEFQSQIRESLENDDDN